MSHLRHSIFVLADLICFVCYTIYFKFSTLLSPVISTFAGVDLRVQ